MQHPLDSVQPQAGKLQHQAGIFPLFVVTVAAAVAAAAAEEYVSADLGSPRE